MVFSTFVIATAYFAFKFILEEKNRYKNAVFLGIFTAFACNTRVVGLFLPFLALIFYIIVLLKEGKYKDYKVYLPAITAVLVFFAVFIIITPATWSGLFEYFKYNLSNSADFTRWNGTVYYLNKFYTAQTQSLPWHYLPVMIIVTTPPLILLFILSGISVLIYTLVKKNFTKRTLLLTVLLASSILPLIFAIVSGSRVYNGWRHFYFIYPSLVICAAYGIRFFVENKNELIKKISQVVVCAAVIIGIIQSCFIIPHGYAYYAFASKSFEGDYWNISSTECIVELLEGKDGQISITYSDKHSAAGLENAVLYLPSEMRERITVCGSIDGADYVFVNPTYYAIADYCDELFVNVSNMEQCAAVRHGKNELTAIYAVNKE